MNGAGILVVNGDVKLHEATMMHWEGMVIILGDDRRVLMDEDNQMRIFGAMVIAGSGERTLFRGTEDYEIGASSIRYNSQALEQFAAPAMDFRFKANSWREIR